MKLLWSDSALKDYLNFQKTDSKIHKKINALIDNIMESPFEGLGKPEHLKNNWSGYWSRRITREHRLVYKVDHNAIFIAQCRFHY